MTPSGNLFRREWFEIIDGHIRADIMPDERVTVLVLDLNEEEADKMLLTFDPLAAMATADNQRLAELLETVRSEPGSPGFARRYSR